MQNKRYRWSAIVIILLLILWLLRPIYFLEILAADSGVVVGQWPTSPGQLFTYTFLHSYEKQPVWEVYRITPDGKLSLVELRFKALAYDNKESTYPLGFKIENGVGIIEDIELNYQEVFKSINIRVAELVPQKLILNGQGEEILLAKLASPGTSLEIRVPYCTRFQYFVSHLFDGKKFKER